MHASFTGLFIREVMEESGRSFTELDAVAVTRGPGSYTGLRIGVSSAKGLCYALDIPLIAIGTLHSMAAGMREKLITEQGISSEGNLLCPMIDAKRMEVYTAVYDLDLNCVREVAAEIITGESFAGLLENGPLWFFGDGAQKCEPILGGNQNARFDVNILPSSKYMVDIAIRKFNSGLFEDIAYFEPYYLKEFLPGIPRVRGLH